MTRSISYMVPGIYPNTTGGMEIFNYFLISEVMKENNVNVYTLKDTPCFRDNVKIIEKKKFLFSKFGIGKLSMASCIGGYIKNDPNQIFHIPYTSNFGIFSLYLNFLFRKYRIPYVIVIHGGGMGKWKIPSMHREFFNRSEAVIGVSENIKIEYEGRIDRSIEVIEPLIPFPEPLVQDAEIKKMIGIPGDHSFILMLGSIKHLKRPELVKRSFISLGEDFVSESKLHLVYAGDGTLRKELESESNGFWKKRIHFAGNVPFEETGSFYNAASYYIIASEFEGTPKSLLGAMYYGVPILASDVTGVNNRVTHEESALLFESGNSGDLTEKLKQMVTDKELSMRLKENARKDYMENYSFNKIVARFLDIYKQIDAKCR